MSNTPEVANETLAARWRLFILSGRLTALYLSGQFTDDELTVIEWLIGVVDEAERQLR